MSLSTFFSKFLNADQYEQIFQKVIILSDIYEKEVSQIFEVITKEASKSTGFLVLFKAIFNSFDSILLQRGIESMELDNIAAVATVFFSKILMPVIQRMKKDFCAENYKKIMKFFQNAFSLQEKYYKANGKQDMNNIDMVEEAIVLAF